MARKVLVSVILIFSLISPFHASASPIFYDDFSSNQLRPEWTVLNEDPTNYWFSNETLLINTLPGDLNTNDYKNLFLIKNPIPNGDFQVTLKIISFITQAKYQQIDIVIYDDEDNDLRCGNVQGDDRIWQLGEKIAGVWSAQNIGGPDAGASSFFLRLVKTGNLFRQYYSLDGNIFHQTNGPINYGDRNPKYLGFAAFESHGVTATPIPVSIKYFSVDCLGTSSCILQLLLND
jgi:hypothetical protein